MRITKIMLAIVCCIALSLSFSANVISESEIYYHAEDITVVFDAESIFSSEQKQFIADKIVSGEPIVADGVSTYAWCWLTGHDIISEIVYAVEHKVYDEIPRCIENIYDVESCTKCDHMDYTLINTSPIFCCPEE